MLLAQWGSGGAGPSQFTGPVYLAVDDAGAVFVSVEGNNRVQVFQLAPPVSAAAATPQTAQLTSQPSAAATTAVTMESLESLWQSSGAPGAELYAAGSVAIDPDGNIWVFDGGGNRFQIFSPDGEYLESWDGTGGGGEAFNSENEEGGFEGDVAFDTQGHIYVVESGARRVQAFAADRKLITSWGSFGTGDGQFTAPLGLALDGAGNVYVSDETRDDIQVFSPDGTFIRRFGAHGSGEGQLSGAGYLTVDSAGTVWVADKGNHRVVAFSSDGAFQSSWGGAGGGPGQFRTPIDVATDAAGHLYVADLDNGAIQVFDSSGQVVAMWEVGSTPSGKLNLPYAVAVDGNGALYVAGVGLDHNSESNLQKFQLPPLG